MGRRGAQAQRAATARPAQWLPRYDEQPTLVEQARGEARLMEHPSRDGGTRIERSGGCRRSLSAEPRQAPRT
jgi:hypothetical protein